jgi:hypothetical protein
MAIFPPRPRPAFPGDPDGGPARPMAPPSHRASGRRPGVCTENSILIDLVTESLNVSRWSRCYASS